MALLDSSSDDSHSDGPSPQPSCKPSIFVNDAPKPVFKSVLDLSDSNSSGGASSDSDVQLVDIPKPHKRGLPQQRQRKRRRQSKKPGLAGLEELTNKHSEEVQCARLRAEQEVDEDPEIQRMQEVLTRSVQTSAAYHSALLARRHADSTQDETNTLLPNTDGYHHRSIVLRSKFPEIPGPPYQMKVDIDHPLDSFIAKIASVKNVSAGDVTLLLDGQKIDGSMTPSALGLDETTSFDVLLAPPMPPVGEPSSAESVELQVRPEDKPDTVLKVRLKMNDSMSKVFDWYAGKSGLPVGCFKLLNDGEVVGHDDTPASLDLEDGFLLDAREIPGAKARHDLEQQGNVNAAAPQPPKAQQHGRRNPSSSTGLVITVLAVLAGQKPKRMKLKSTDKFEKILKHLSTSMSLPLENLVGRWNGVDLRPLQTMAEAGVPDRARIEVHNLGCQ